MNQSINKIVCPDFSISINHRHNSAMENNFLFFISCFFFIISDD
jgi:hypothetical protein